MSSASTISIESDAPGERAKIPNSVAFPADRDVVSSLRAGSNCAQPESASPAGTLEPGLTVAVCTYKRAQSLVRFLDSLRGQERKPEALIIVDASPDDETEQAVRAYKGIEQLAGCLLYFRVTGHLRGLTRQRNFALRWAATDLVAFFDDDIVLLPGCLSEMEKACRSPESGIVGVGGFIQNESSHVTLSWRVRLKLRMVSSLEPGKYHPCSNTTPWSFLPPTDRLIEGDFLPGCAMMWRTEVARETGFNDNFDRYALGEDVDFSLRAGRTGKLVMVGTAHVLHMHEWGGRPDPFRLGYMEIYNRYQIQHRAVPVRTWRSVGWFIYGWGLDTVMLARHLLTPGKWTSTSRQIAGRLRAAFDILRGH